MSFEFPCLDVKILNNGDKTLLFSEAVLAVKKSAPDLAPVVFLESGYDQIQYMRLRNDGWGKIEGGRLDFDLFREGGKTPIGKHRFHRELGPFSESTDVSVTAELEALGVDAKKLKAENALQMGREKIEQALGKLAVHMEKDGFRMDYSVGCAGDLELDWKDAAGAAQKTRVKFKAKILVVPPDGLGAPGPVEGAYQALLEADRADYTVRVPITQEARAGQMTRCVLTVGVPRSSKHELTLRLGTADGAVVESGPIRLEALLTRSCVAALKRGAATEAPADAQTTTADEEASPSPAASPSAAP